MATVFDVAAYILKTSGAMSAMKLQKLVYYAQAWSLVWDEKPLFDEKIQAWLAGPVVPALYAKHKGCFIVDKNTFKKVKKGDPNKLNNDERETVDAVLDFYGKRSAEWLSDLTHKERPWRDARNGVGEMDNSENEISLESMATYYTRVAEVAKTKPEKDA